MNVANWGVRTKLLGTLGILIVSLLTINVIGLGKLEKSNMRISEMFEYRAQPIANVGSIYGAQLESVQVLDAALALRTHEATDVAVRVTQDNRKLIGEHFERWRTLSDSEQSRRDQAAVDESRRALMEATDQILRLLARGDFDGALAVRVNQLEPALKPLKAAIADALDYQLTAAAQMRERAKADFRSERIMIFAMSFIAIAITVGAALLLVGYIMGALRSAMSVADRIANGRLGQEIEVRTSDEFGTLLASLKKMDAKLSEIVGSVRTASEQVGSAAGQIAQGNDDLSQRTQEQASALEQTAASMEEMTSTVKQNADNARQAKQLAEGARAHAERGGQVVSEAVGAMQEINASSRQIADIIGVIDGIAFQTNLLALNAAVEAARAGEQGRGFSVVAGEVRALAEQSKTSTVRVRQILGEIQRATSAAVMATEQGNKQVEQGAKQVREAGETIRKLAEAVQAAAQAAAQISASAGQQSTGMSQIKQAVGSIQQAAQQNLAATKQAEAAARELNRLGVQLSQLVGTEVRSRSAA